jgi:outer membrane protein assembly factor BamB
LPARAGLDMMSPPMKVINFRSLLLLCFASVLPAAPSEVGKFESLGIPVRVGGLMGCVVGPDGRGGEALYFNLNQAAAPLFLVQVNPDTGEARQFNAPQGPGAWAFIVGPDEKIYLGTWESGWLLRFDPKQPGKGIENLGKPAESETYLWQFAIGKDGKIYSCTYPNAKLVSFDPATGQSEDLGRMHPTEMYARSVAAGADGLIYVAIGTQQGDIVAYDPKTREHHSALPESLRENPQPDSGAVSLGADGHVYGFFRDKTLRLENGKATLVKAASAPPPLKLRDGRVVTARDRGSFTLQDPKTGESTPRKFKYAGAGDLIFVVGNGPGGCIYGSTAMPMEIFRYDPKAKSSEHLGGMPGGEVYSLLEREGKLYLCYYGGAIMNLYDPAKPFWKFGTGADCNPISFGGVGDGHLRPRAMIDGPEGMMYVGSEPPYGQLGGAMGVWDPRLNKTVENYRNLVTNQSIVSLAWEPKSGLIFGGSANVGGGGTRPSEKEAKFFAFDPKQKKKVFETALVTGATKYPATFAVKGKVFTTVGDQMIEFDPQAMKAVKTIPLPGAQTEIALGQDRAGRLVGLTTKGVYILDPEKSELVHTAASPVPVNCGFALTDDAVYFGSKAELWRYALPAPTAPR